MDQTPAHLQDHRGHGRRHAPGAAQAPARQDLEHRAAQARGRQPGGLGEGPAGDVDDRARGEARDDQAGRLVDRGDQRQHRDRAGDGGGDPRLPDDLDHARAPVGGAPPDDARLRRRDHPHAQVGRHGGGARPGREDAARGQGEHPRPVCQPRQPAVAFRGHGPGDLARTLGTLTLSSTAWARWHDHGCSRFFKEEPEIRSSTASPREARVPRL